MLQRFLDAMLDRGGIYICSRFTGLRAAILFKDLPIWVIVSISRLVDLPESDRSPGGPLARLSFYTDTRRAADGMQRSNHLCTHLAIERGKSKYDC